MEGQSGAENGGEHYLGVESVHFGRSQGSGHLLDAVLQGFADLVCEYLPEPLEVGAETQAVFLHFLVSHFSDERIQQGVFFSKID